ncbi:N(4)-(beta-N-acetylglucosaminyl)-L-asparaginase, partial [Enterobacter hormaechei subsp. steigerwaltii]
GAATNIKTFSFVVATARQPLTVFRTERLREKTHYHAVDEEWMQAYAARIRAPIEEL